MRYLRRYRTARQRWAGLSSAAGFPIPNRNNRPKEKYNFVQGKELVEISVCFV